MSKLIVNVSTGEIKQVPLSKEEQEQYDLSSSTEQGKAETFEKIIKKIEGRKKILEQFIDKLEADPAILNRL